MADVYAPLDASNTVLVCSTGGVINETVQALATTCAVSCTVKTLYDQSGALNCGGSACDLSQGTIALRPTLTLSCLGSLPCMTSAGSARLGTSSNSAVAQPFTITSGVKRTAGTTYSVVLTRADGNAGLFMGNIANRAELYAGSDALFVQSDNSWHAIQGIFNGASSSGTTDGSTTGSLNPGTSGLTTGPQPLMGIFNDGANDHLTGTIVEVGLWGSSFSGGQLTSMDTNIRAYWGF